MTDDAIIEMIRKPSSREEGFRQLVIKYQRRLYDVVRIRMKTHEDTDDVLQNTFLKIFRHIGSFEGRSELFTWMYRIACNEVVDQQKRNSRMKLVELENRETIMADAFVDNDDVTRSLQNAIARLPERQQTVFRMRYFDDMAYKEISEILGVSEGALKASFHHAVKKIEEEFRAKQIL
jgi:RNA polymerase sigma factor (sigma-70 family)